MLPQLLSLLPSSTPAPDLVYLATLLLSCRNLGVAAAAAVVKAAVPLVTKKLLRG
jgi:hypothetical protein